MKNTFYTIICVLIILFVLANQCDNSLRQDRGLAKPQAETDYETNTHPHNIVSCPKCGKLYNKDTWGEMCNTCWSEGRGLKSKGEYIIK
ncbi:hypothetical protein GCM10007424_01340 [Flavobacterium suaedae]|uniref:Uncharacterized protein n=1 Tax=Flavobacterium suaedae TaxID=1767027 RepID=A0ABQ1JC55_9FLAO|nr:hypothetical protein [Flavobacterium suaedae]GGB65161.1 hypothetical protein GCM10007424_01340 [Flavobacterium suaedae]